MSELAGKVALVTGGGRGIGRSVCEKLGAAGANVIVNYSRSSGAADEVVAAITAAGGSASAVQFDVSDAEAVDAAVKDIVKTHGGLDILVNNAGIAIDSLLMRAKQEDWERTLQVNLSGAFYCAKAVSRPMMKAKEGRIINISSVIGEMGNAGQVAYSSSKAGLLGLTKSLAKELASRAITVNAITPGYITTDMTAELTDEIRDKIIAEVPLQSLGAPDDIANAVVFLASPSARYITGQVLGVNGGMYM